MGRRTLMTVAVGVTLKMKSISLVMMTDVSKDQLGNPKRKV
jgi:hypothetical protein